MCGVPLHSTDSHYLRHILNREAEYLKLFENSGLEHVKLVHMKGCQTLENGKDNWYALVGYKKEEE